MANSSAPLAGTVRARGVAGLNVSDVESPALSLPAAEECPIIGIGLEGTIPQTATPFPGFLQLTEGMERCGVRRPPGLRVGVLLASRLWEDDAGRDAEYVSGNCVQLNQACPNR